MTYGEKLAQLRKSKNMTQVELGEKLNVSSQAVSKWERDQSEPDIATIKEISKIFDISIDELLTSENDNINKVETSVDVLENKEKYQDIEIGVCTVCGCKVTEDNLGEKQPKLKCKNCLVEEKSKIAKSYKNRTRLSLIVGVSAALIIIIFGLGISISGVFSTERRIINITLSLLIAVGGYTLISDIILHYSKISRELGKAVFAVYLLPRKVIKKPMFMSVGIQFIKFLLSIFAFLGGLFISIISICIGMLMTLVLYPIEQSKANKYIKENYSNSSLESTAID